MKYCYLEVCRYTSFSCNTLISVLIHGQDVFEVCEKGSIWGAFAWLDNSLDKFGMTLKVHRIRMELQDLG